MNYICLWGILASITGIAILFSVIKHKKSVSAIKNGTYWPKGDCPWRTDAAA